MERLFVLVISLGSAKRFIVYYHHWGIRRELILFKNVVKIREDSGYLGVTIRVD